MTLFCVLGLEHGTSMGCKHVLLLMYTNYSYLGGKLEGLTLCA